MKVKILKTSPNAVIPNKAYPTDFCYDCVAVSEEEIAPNVWKYGLGIALQVERLWEVIGEYGKTNQEHVWFDFKKFVGNISIDARPRSSIWKTGMILSNCEGTIDESYTGEVSAVFYHVKPDMPRYKVGDRVCQIKLGFTLPMDFVEVDSLDKTDRGANGYGSSGK